MTITAVLRECEAFELICRRALEKGDLGKYSIAELDKEALKLQNAFRAARDRISNSDLRGDRYQIMAECEVQTSFSRADEFLSQLKSPLGKKVFRSFLESTDGMATETSDSAMTPAFIRLAAGVYECTKVSVPQSIVVLTRLESGWGDFFSALNGVKSLRQIFPEAKVRAVILADQEKQASAPLINLDEYGVEEIEWSQEFTPSSDLDFFVMWPKPANCFQKNLGGYWPEHVPKLCIEEYEMNSCCPEDFEVMGVSNASVGIFHPEISIPAEFKDRRLDALFEQPVKPFFCYMTMPYYFWKFVIDYTKDSELPLHIITPFANEYRGKPWYKDPSPNGWGRQLDLSTFCRVELSKWTAEGGIEKEILHEGSGSKVLQLANPFPLCHADFLRCMSRSQSVVGNTGDISFSEVWELDEEHIPYYEMHNHKRPFWHSMKGLAQRNGKDRVFAFAEKLTLQRDTTYPEVNPDLVKDPLLLEEINALRAITKKDHNVMTFLKPLVHRAILLAKIPELREIENGLYEEYKCKKNSLFALQKQLVEKLAQHGVALY